ncbi:hypothetical protein [Rhodovulum sp. BSW8]|uniref:hypothetical protein n=1 Tax=Rhodovulum sp. BSW8 TaxID=2259645 RepID=UPI001058E579|nr:hypothetical protein [Rhodovulum sp. BSW8]
MLEKNPKNPFNLEAGSSLPPHKNTPLRDKDNAKTQLKPNYPGLRPAGNVAPPGAKGIQQGLTPRASPSTRPRFTLGEGGKLKGLFKPIAAKAPDKGHGHDL